jgi:LysR family transcriptional regulator, benzoate and cis,cis-muconate-responsive activator of ben and cat genes
METRELRCFVAVAEELHFGRAAERLGIAQPPLSRTIGQLERRLGVALLTRTSRKVALTDAGSVLLSEGRGVLAALAAAERRTRQAAMSRVGLVLAAKAGTADELLAKLLDAYAAEPGAVPVEILLCDSQQQRVLLFEGQADVALMHLPFESPAGLDTQELRTERQVAVLPRAHPLAERKHVRSADVAALPDLPLARWPRPDGIYPDGPGAEIRNLTQLFQLVALGRTTAILPNSSCTDLRRDLVAVPVVDAPTVTTVIAWLPTSRSQALAALIRRASSI